MKIMKHIIIIVILSFSVFCDKFNNSRIVYQVAHNYIQNDTMGLIIFDYKSWFLKYVEKRTPLNEDTCEKNGCFFPEEIYLYSEVSFMPIEQIKYGKIDWNMFICDTSFMFNKVNKETLEIDKIGIVFSGKQVIVGGNVVEQKYKDTTYILLYSNNKLPIIGNTATHLSKNKMKEYFLWLNNAMKK